MSDNLDEAEVFFIAVKGKPSIRVEVSFCDFHDCNLAYHYGTAITRTGNGTQQGDQLVITKVTDFKSLSGKKAGTNEGDCSVQLI
jgi:hypothetical protein